MAVGIAKKLAILGSVGKQFILGDQKGKTLYEKIQEKLKDRVDQNLPLDIKIGSMVVIDTKSDAILGEGKFLFPDVSGESEIIGFGTIKASDDLKITRFYARTINKKDKDNKPIEILFIIDIGEEDKKITSIKLYCLYQGLALSDEENSKPVNEQDEAVLSHWIGGDNPLIGIPEFKIIRDGKEYIYHKTLGGVHNVELENIFDLPKDEDIDEEKHMTAYYSRKLDGELSYDGGELCMLRLTETSDSASIQIFIGVEINEIKIKVME